MNNLLRVRIRLFGITYRLLRLARRTLRLNKTVFVQQRVDAYREFWRNGAKRLGMELQDLAYGYWEVRESGRIVTRINNYVVDLDDPVTLNIAGDKVLTFELLQAGGVTIPEHRVIHQRAPQDFVAFTAEQPSPWVVKPARGTSSGLGISTMLCGENDCARATAMALTYCDEAVIERHIAGECYRLLYLDNRLIRAARRSGVRVRGDGHSSIGALVADTLQVSAATARTDKDILHTLAAQQLRIDDVMAKDEWVLARSSSLPASAEQEVRTEYDEDVTHLVCQALADECGTATRLIGSEFCGVDVITTDPTVSLSESGGVIDEINTTPGLHHHYGLRRPDEHVASRAVDQAILEEDAAAQVLGYIANRGRSRVWSGSQGQV